MGKPYPPELRDRIIAAREEGYSYSELEERFRVGVSTVIRYMRSYRDHGTTRPAQIGGYKDYKLKGYEDVIRDWLKADPDMTLDQMQARLRQDYDFHVGRTAIHNFLTYLNISYKKRQSSRASSTVRT